MVRSTELEQSCVRILRSFGRGRPLAANNFFMFYGQTVGDMNKTHNTNMIENNFVQFCKFLFFC